MRKAIEGYEGLYEVSDTGRVYSLDRSVPSGRRMMILKGRELRQTADGQGRFCVALSCRGVVTTRRVSRLVAETFIANPDGLPCVDHINGNPSDNSVGNLRWVTLAGNMRNKHKTSGASGAVGVDRRPHCKNKPWRAQGTDRAGKPTHLGYFASKEEAEQTYRAFRAANF